MAEHVLAEGIALLPTMTYPASKMGRTVTDFDIFNPEAVYCVAVRLTRIDCHD